MARPSYLRAAGIGVLISLIAVLAIAPPVLGYGFAARASVTPTTMFVGDSAGTTLTFTVRNTGTRKSLAAVQISRPFSFWTILSCPTAPTGWTSVATTDDCQYLSAPGTADDIQRHTSATFTLEAATASDISNRAGTWRVVVSQTNNFAQPTVLKQAASESPGLKTTAYSLELTDVIVAAGSAVVGDPCPSSNTVATGGTATLVACGINHTNAAQRTRAPYTHLAGTLIKSSGTWHGGVIPSSGSPVVLGYWSGVKLWAGSGLAINAKVGAYPARTSATTSFGGYSAPGAPQATIVLVASLLAAKDGQTAKFAAHITNTGNVTDSYSLSTGGAWSATVYDEACTTPLTTTPTLEVGDSFDVCVKVDIPGSAVEQDTSDTTLSATSSVNSSVAGSATLTAMAVQFDVLIVDGDTNAPVDSASYYKDALDANGVDYGYWDLSVNPDLLASYLNGHANVIWFTGGTESAPLSAYETELTTYLDAGGRLMLSGQDVLDGSAGTTTFVHDYLHVDWDGTEVQNDKATTAVHSVDGNPVTDGIGDVTIDHSVLGSSFEDQLTPIAPADAAYTDDNTKTDALTVSALGYKVVFLAFPFEAYGSATYKADLMNRVLTWFGS